MKIRLRRNWFAPDISGSTSKKYVGRNGRPTARGHRLRKGIHTVPDEWEKLLPSDAQILEGPVVLEEDEREYDPAVPGVGYKTSLLNQESNETFLAGMKHSESLAIKAENDRQAEIAENRRANLAKANEAKAAKKAEKEENKDNA